LPLKGVLKTGAEFLHAHARARLFVLLFWRSKKVGRLSGETDGRLNSQIPQANRVSQTLNRQTCQQRGHSQQIVVIMPLYLLFVVQFL
jgi:hypothetical protein